MSLTMSSLPRLFACSGSAVLPQAHVHNPWADLGVEEHDALSVLNEERDRIEHDFAHLIPPGARSEVRIAYDVSDRTARILGEGAGREYGDLRPFEIPGSIDVLGVQGDAVVVLDWKTGFFDVEPASRNSQLWGYGLAAARALGKSRAILRIVYTKRKNQLDEYEADALELAAFADRLERLHVEVIRRRRDYGARAQAAGAAAVSTSEGPWCRYCPSKAFCPSKNALLVQISERGLAVVGDTQMTPGRASEAARRVLDFEQLAKDAKKRLIAYVEANGPIHLGDGRYYGRHHRPGDEKIVDVEKVDQAIAELVPVGDVSRFSGAAFERSTSKAAIGRAAKSLGRRGHTVLARRVVDRVRELGGIKPGNDEYPIGEFTIGGEPAALPADDVAEIDRLLEGA